MEFIQIIAILGILLVLFVLLREVNCWYWKINERLNLLKSIEKHLKETKPEEIKSELLKPEEKIKSRWACPKCGAMNPPDAISCTNCHFEST